MASHLCISFLCSFRILSNFFLRVAGRFLLPLHFLVIFMKCFIFLLMSEIAES